MNKWLINPFNYISGWSALLLGVVALLLMSLISTFTYTHLDGVLDVHYGSSGEFVVFLRENLLSWAALMSMFGLFGLAISGRTFRFLDMAAYTAMMRLPLIIAVLLPFVFDGSTVADYLIYNILNLGEPVSVSSMQVVGFIVMVFLTIIVVFWSLIWGYFAFKILFNISGVKAAALYFMAILLAEALVKVAIYVFFGADMLINIPM
jgi:hypothetical protein